MIRKIAMVLGLALGVLFLGRYHQGGADEPVWHQPILFGTVDAVMNSQVEKHGVFSTMSPSDYQHCLEGLAEIVEQHADNPNLRQEICYRLGILSSFAPAQPWTKSRDLEEQLSQYCW